MIMAFPGCLGVPIAAILLLGLAAAASAQLSGTFYDSSCPSALATIKSAVTAAVNNEPRMGASLLRLHFHDCFVQGCDASVLLNDTATFTGEQTAFPNRNSIRGLDVIDAVKAQVEAVCAQTVSCADILAVAARDSIVALGGASYTVPLGRRDSTTASLSEANSDLPPPTSDLADLVGNFSRKGLSVTDMVALSGAHTIGQAACRNFRSRIYGESNINATYAASLQANCAQSSGVSDGNLAPLDVTTPDAFDNAYYGNLVSQRGLLHSDQQLLNGGSTDALVNTYASNAAQFSADFATAVVNMGNIGVLTGVQGEIRLNCAKVN